MKVNFWCMRHGEKDAAGNVTARGLRQVEASAVANLSGVPFDVILHSPAQRAEDSARRVQTALNLNCSIVRFPAFGSFLAQDETTPQLSIKEAYARIGKPHAEITVFDWLEHYGWTAGCLRGIMQAAMLAAVIYLKTTSVMKGDLAPPDINVLVVGHSPGLEMAADDPATTSLNEADIIGYEVKVDQFGFVSIQTVQTYRCPPVE